MKLLVLFDLCWFIDREIEYCFWRYQLWFCAYQIKYSKHIIECFGKQHLNSLYALSLEKVFGTCHKKSNDCNYSYCVCWAIACHTGWGQRAKTLINDILMNIMAQFRHNLWPTWFQVWMTRSNIWRTKNHLSDDINRANEIASDFQYKINGTRALHVICCDQFK